MVYSLAFLVVLRVVGRPVALVVARAKLHLAAQILKLATATLAIITALVAAWFIAIDDAGHSEQTCSPCRPSFGSLNYKCLLSSLPDLNSNSS